MPSNSGLVVAIATNGRPVMPQWAHAMMIQSYPSNMTITPMMLFGLEVGESRDALVEEALKMGAEFIWFVDDDTAPPFYAISKLIYELRQRPEFDVIGGIYCLKAIPPAPLVYRGDGRGEFWDWAVDDVFEVTGIGTGCMLIRTSIFEKLPKPWFCTTVSTPEPNEKKVVKEGYTDDLYFCAQAVRNGHRILAHGGVLCEHWDTGIRKAARLPLDSLPYRNKAAGKVTQPMSVAEEVEA